MNTCYRYLSDNCKKDLLIVLDISYSIGRATFQDKVKPFLEKFVKDPNLNVGTQGTHIAMIVFSNTAKTKVLRNFGAKSTQKDVEAFIKSLDWNKLSGDRTRTGLALKMANNKVICSFKTIQSKQSYFRTSH